MLGCARRVVRLAHPFPLGSFPVCVGPHVQVSTFDYPTLEFTCTTFAVEAVKVGDAPGTKPVRMVWRVPNPLTLCVGSHAALARFVVSSGMLAPSGCVVPAGAW